MPPCGAARGPVGDALGAEVVRDMVESAAVAGDAMMQVGMRRAPLGATKPSSGRLEGEELRQSASSSKEGQRKRKRNRQAVAEVGSAKVVILAKGTVEVAGEEAG